MPNRPWGLGLPGFRKWLESKDPEEEVGFCWSGSWVLETYLQEKGFIAATVNSSLWYPYGQSWKARALPNWAVEFSRMMWDVAKSNGFFRGALKAHQALWLLESSVRGEIITGPILTG